MWLINGQAETGLSPLDRGIAYGDGVFRTLKTSAGKPLWWADHYAALAHDCAALALVCPEERILLAEIKAVAHALTQAVVKITVTRGEGLRGYAPPDPASPTRIVTASPLPDYANYAHYGVNVRWCELRLARQAQLAGIKHLNRLENVLARQEWADPNIAEGLLCDDTDAVIGGTMTNIFTMCDGRLHTPDLSLSGIAGVTRTRVLRAARAHAIDVQIGRLEKADILAADEVFLSNSIAGLWRIARLDTQQWVSAEWTEQFTRWIYEAD